MSEIKLYKIPQNTKYDLYYAPKTKELYIKFSTGRYEKLQRNTKRVNYKDILQRAQASYKQRQQILSQIKQSVKTTIQKELIKETYSALSSFFEKLNEIQEPQGIFERVTDHTLVVPVDNNTKYDLTNLDINQNLFRFSVKFNIVYSETNKITKRERVNILYSPDLNLNKLLENAIIKSIPQISGYDIEIIDYTQLDITKDVFIEPTPSNKFLYKQLQSTPLKTGHYRSARLDDDKTHVYDDLSDYNFVFFKNLMQTKKNQCYAPIYDDLKKLCSVQLKDNENTPKKLLDYIKKYNNKLNYYVADSDLMIPTATKFRRQIVISNQWSHIFVSNVNKPLFQDIFTLSKDKEIVYYNIEDQNKILKEQLSQNIVPVILNNTIYTDTKVYKDKCSVQNNDIFMPMFKPDQFVLCNYKYNELLFRDMNYIHGGVCADDDEYITLDMTSFYRTMLINTTFYEFSQIIPFNNIIVPANLYYIECPLTEDIEDYSVTYQILYQYTHAINYMSGELINYFKTEFNISLVPFIKFCLIAHDKYQLSKDQVQWIQSLNKLEINQLIGCLNFNQKDQVFEIPCLKDNKIHRETYNISQSGFITYKLIHCQMMNYRFLWQLKHLPPLENIVQIKTDSVTFKRVKEDINKLKSYGYHEEAYKALKNINNYEVQNIFKNKTLINAFPGSGKTHFIKEQLKIFRQQRDQVEYNLNKDDKCLVLVCGLNNVEQYKEFYDVADVRCYQFMEFMKNYQFINKYKHIYVDEVYMMDAKFVYTLLLIADQYITFVGDKYQQCNMNYKLSDYDILSLCQNKGELTKNYRNKINYKQFLYNEELDKFEKELYQQESSQQDTMLLFEHKTHKELVQQYKERHPECQDKTKLSRARLLDFVYSSSYFRGNNNNPDVINICVSNQECFELNYEYKGDNVINKSNNKNKKPVRLSEINQNKENFIIDSACGGVLKTKDGKTIDCYYGNSYTVYQIQGLEFEKINIVSPEKMNVNQLFVAISRVKTQEQSKYCPYEHKIDGLQADVNDINDMSSLTTYKDLQLYFFKHQWTAHLLCQYIGPERFVIKYDFDNEYIQLYNIKFTMELSQKEQELLKQSGLNFCFINICNIDKRLQTLNAPQTQLKTFCAPTELDLIINELVKDQSEIYNSYFETEGLKTSQYTLKQYKDNVKNTQLQCKQALCQICQKYLSKKEIECQKYSQQKICVSDDEEPERPNYD